MRTQNFWAGATNQEVKIDVGVGMLLERAPDVCGICSISSSTVRTTRMLTGWASASAVVLTDGT